VSKYVSNRAQSDAALGATMRKHILEVWGNYARLIDEEFRQPKSGRLYGINAKKLRALRRYRAGLRKTRPGGLHRASAGGEAPAIDTAALRKSVGYVLVKISAIAWELQIGSTMQSGRGSPQSHGRSIAEMLEFGTVHMKPRPSWRPALARLKEMYLDKRMVNV
jgi:hypothetical protein